MSEGKHVHIADKSGNMIKGIEVDVDGKSLQISSSFKYFNTVFPALNSFKSRPSDIWICAYPKAGTHWTNEIVLLLLHGHHSSKAKTEFMLEACTTIDDFKQCSTSLPRILNTHIPFKYLPSTILESKIVYVIRNPLSIAVSRYHHTVALNFGYTGTLEDYIESFAEDGTFSFYGTWFEHVKQAIDASRNCSNILLMFYEEMVEDPRKAVTQIAKFVGRDITNAEVEDVVRQTTLKNMKERFSNIYHEEVVGQGIPSQVFIRRGEISEWKGHVNPDFLKKFMDRFHKEMHDYPEVAACKFDS